LSTLFPYTTLFRSRREAKPIFQQGPDLRSLHTVCGEVEVGEEGPGTPKAVQTLRHLPPVPAAKMNRDRSEQTQVNAVLPRRVRDCLGLSQKRLVRGVHLRWMGRLRMNVATTHNIIQPDSMGLWGGR